MNCSGHINLNELNSAIEHIHEAVGKDTYVMWGTVSPEDQSEQLIVTIIATGLSPNVRTEYTLKAEANKQINDKKNALLNHPMPGVQERSLVIPTFLQHAKNK